MSQISESEPTGTSEPREPLDTSIVRDIVADAIERYLEETRARIDPFVDTHFSFRGARALHRRAVGWDLLRAPVNVLLAVPQVLALLGSALARWAGWRRAADWLDRRHLLLATDVSREIDWLVHTELLRLPYRSGPRESTRDALAEAVFSDPRIEDLADGLTDALERRASDADFRRDLADKLAVYTGSRSAAAELTTAAVSIAIGAAAFKQLTPGVVSLGPAVAAAAAQQAAIAGFPLGSWLGGLWYGVFPVTPSLSTTIGVSVGLALVFSLVAAFAGLAADPVQRRLGIHRRRLRKLVATIELSLRGDGSERFEVRDHYVARILDVADLLRAALSRLH